MASSEVKATAFTTKVKVPVKGRIILHASEDFSFWEKKFIEDRDQTLDAEKKRNYDMCRLTIKWAETCGAFLNSVSNPENGVEFTLTFDKIDNLVEFVKNLNVNVNEANF